MRATGLRHAPKDKKLKLIYEIWKVKIIKVISEVGFRIGEKNSECPKYKLVTWEIAVNPIKSSLDFLLIFFHCVSPTSSLS